MCVTKQCFSSKMSMENYNLDLYPIENILGTVMNNLKLKKSHISYVCLHICKLSYCHLSHTCFKSNIIPLFLVNYISCIIHIPYFLIVHSSHINRIAYTYHISLTIYLNYIIHLIFVVIFFSYILYIVFHIV